MAPVPSLRLLAGVRLIDSVAQEAELDASRPPDARHFKQWRFDRPCEPPEWASWGRDDAIADALGDAARLALAQVSDSELAAFIKGVPSSAVKPYVRDAESEVLSSFAHALEERRFETLLQVARDAKDRLDEAESRTRAALERARAYDRTRQAATFLKEFKRSHNAMGERPQSGRMRHVYPMYSAASPAHNPSWSRQPGPSFDLRDV